MARHHGGRTFFSGTLNHAAAPPDVAETPHFFYRHPHFGPPIAELRGFMEKHTARRFGAVLEIISAAGEFQHSQQWHFLATDGIYRSRDGGKTLERVLSETGSAAKPEPSEKAR